MALLHGMRRFLTRRTHRLVLVASMVVVLIAMMTVGVFTPQPAEAAQNTQALNQSQGLNNFGFVQISDPHVGIDMADFGTAGYNDSSIGNQGSTGEKYLTAAVQWINNNRSSQNIRFVIVTGDLTESGERSEFQRAKQILDGLLIPYIPVLGNHDVWPYTSTQEASSPCGDQYFWEVFSGTFTRLKQAFPRWDDGTRNQSIWNSEKQCQSRFQNFAFGYNEYRFIMTDFTTRTHAITGSGALGSADLHDFTGGTIRWLSSQLQTVCSNTYYTKRAEHVLLFDHHGCRNSTFFAFTSSELDKIKATLLPYYTKVGLWAAGHWHTEATYDLVSGATTICPVREVNGYPAYPNLSTRLYKCYGVQTDTGRPSW